jgi:hypothetical protein
MYRFAIRDLLWLTVVAAMGAAWSVEHQENIVLRPMRQELADLEATLRSSFGTDQEAAALLQAFKASRNMNGPNFVSIRIHGQKLDAVPTPTFDSKPASCRPHAQLSTPSQRHGTLVLPNR